MAIKELSDLNSADRATHVEVYGGYNDFPPNWREVTEAEIATRSQLRCYSPVLVEFRQMGKLVPGGPPMLDAKLHYFHDGTGAAMHFDYHGKRVRWFMFERCAHTFRELSMAECREKGLYHAGRCWHVSECTKCNYIYSVDSSD